MGDIGAPELILLLLVGLLLFGAKRLPEIGRSLGFGMREFKDSVSGITRDEPVAPTTISNETHSDSALSVSVSLYFR